MQQGSKTNIDCLHLRRCTVASGKRKLGPCLIAFFSLIVLFGNSTIARGQPDTAISHTNFWIGGGLGYSIAGGGPETNVGGGLAGRASASLQFGDAVTSARITANIGGGTTKSGLFGKTVYVTDEFFDVGLLIGYGFQPSDQLRVVFSTGVASVWGNRVGSGKFDSRFGVPLEVVLISTNETLGVGVIAHANINGEELFAALTINFLIGNFH